MDREPKFQKEIFICPHCGVVSRQTWFSSTNWYVAINKLVDDFFYEYRKSVRSSQQNTIEVFVEKLRLVNVKRIPRYVPHGFSLAKCLSCNSISIWVEQEMVYPRPTMVDPPNEDMEPEIQELYREAARILADSPKGSAALLRLALQLLLKQLGKDGKNINNDIKALVAEGLNPKIQQALDLLHIVGNNAVHPGRIDLRENVEIVPKLFMLLNLIADEKISKPKAIEKLYSTTVPEETQQHINDRDNE